MMGLRRRDAETQSTPTIVCRCGADVFKTGLTLESAVRETYMAVAGGLQRVSSSQGEPDMAYCLLCDAPVPVDIAAFLRSLRD